MAFHEGFWVVTGTAAPIIALAAVVSLAEAERDYYNTLASAVRAVSRMPGGEKLANSPDDTPDVTRIKIIVRVLTASQRVEPLSKTLTWLATFGVVNLILQAALLAISLVSLAGAANLLSPWLAIVAAVGGLLLLAASSLGVVYLRLINQLVDEDEALPDIVGQGKSGHLPGGAHDRRQPE